MYRYLIRYHPGWGALFLGLTALELAGFAVTRSWLAIVLAIPTLLLGVLYLTRPFLVLEDGQVKVQNLWGMTRRRFPFGALGDLTVEPGVIVIGKQRLRFSARLTRRADVRALADAVRAARAPASRPAPAPPPP